MNKHNAAGLTNNVRNVHIKTVFTRNMAKRIVRARYLTHKRGTCVVYTGADAMVRLAQTERGEQ